MSSLPGTSAVVNDPTMTFLEAALDPDQATTALRRNLPGLGGRGGRFEVARAALIRHRPGRRGLIEYQLRLRRPGEPIRLLTVLGKVRARGLDQASYRHQCALWQAGFRAGNGRAFAVPQPLGVVPEYHLWLQQAVPGEVAAESLAGPTGREVAGRIALAGRALHQGNLAPTRHHTLADELLILHAGLQAVARQEPRWAARLDHLLASAVQLALTIPISPAAVIHRDFYADQVLIDHDELYLLDFDLVSRGDPALDIGNFAGHLIEQGLRQYGDPMALAGRVEALEEAYLRQVGGRHQRAVRAYTTLTLLRHIAISQRISPRRHLTEALIALGAARLQGGIMRF